MRKLPQILSLTLEVRKSHSAWLLVKVSIGSLVSLVASFKAYYLSGTSSQVRLDLFNYLR